jgi:superoxide dismutase
MKFELPGLPYAIDALEPHLTVRTLEVAYGRHHRGYLEKPRKLIEGTPQAKVELSDFVTQARGEIVDNAAQCLESHLLLEQHDSGWWRGSVRPDWGAAYHLDYLNARQHYVEAFVSHFANWRFADANLATCDSKGTS